MTPFIVITNTQTPDYLAVSYEQPGQALAPDVVRNDAEDVSVSPVIQNTPGVSPIYSPDYDPTDELTMAIGLVDTPPTAGSVDLLVGATAVNGVAYNVTAAALQTALNVALTTEGEPLCTVVENEDGAYTISGVTDGEVVDGFFSVADASLLYPISDAFFVMGGEGSVSSKYVYTFVMRQAPMCVADLTDELPAADVVVTTVQSGSGTANKIQEISFTNTPYTGSYTVSGAVGGVTASCGVVNWGITAEELGLILARHPSVKYQSVDGTADNIAPSFNNGKYYVEFMGTLANNDANAFSALNYNLQGPAGKSGLIHYNTQGLYIYSLSQGDSFQLTRTIQRTRTSGEVLTIYSGLVTILKDAINAATYVPSPLTSYYTSAQVNSLLAAKQDIEGAYTSKTANYTATTSDQYIDCTANSFTVTLPTAASIAGQTFTILNTGSGTITVDTTSSQLISGSLTQTLPAGSTITVVSSGSYWTIL